MQFKSKIGKIYLTIHLAILVLILFSLIINGITILWPLLVAYALGFPWSVALESFRIFGNKMAAIVPEFLVGNIINLAIIYSLIAVIEKRIRNKKNQLATSKNELKIESRDPHRPKRIALGIVMITISLYFLRFARFIFMTTTMAMWYTDSYIPCANNSAELCPDPQYFPTNTARLVASLPLLGIALTFVAAILIMRKKVGRLNWILLVCGIILSAFSFHLVGYF